jgi:hypothetical protein
MQLQVRFGEKDSIVFWLSLLLANLAMGFLCGYCFRAANDPPRQKPEISP